MLFWVAELIFMLVVILAAAQLFTNALEYFGHRAGFSAGVTGSIFAAVATALPETTVPLIALLAGTSDTALNQDISIGAILGAPLMISTLSTALMALFALPKRGLRGHVQPERVGFLRDLHFFIVAYLLSLIALYLPLNPLYGRLEISALLVSLYGIYLWLTFRSSKKLVADGHGVIPDEPLMFSRCGLGTGQKTIALQIFLGLLLLVVAAKGFIEGVEGLSKALGVSALVVSLLIVPIATELPEKVNSIFWVRKRKDTLAFGNLTGAMVFQGTLLPALGVLLEAWQPHREILTAIWISLVAAFWLRLQAGRQGLTVYSLLLSGLLYCLYFYLVCGY